MKTNRKLIYTVVAIFCLGTLFIIGCSGVSPEVRIQWVGSAVNNEMSYSYTSWTGTEEKTIHLNDGDSLLLAYAATVNKGSVTFSLQSPGKDVLWESSHTESFEEQEITLPVPESGTYVLFVIGEGTGGSFSVSWLID